ncbi:MAG TPA: YcfL family protein [Verrucomicrobiae bacterium]
MKTKIAALFAVALAVAGCHDTMNSVENAQKEGQRNMVSDARVVSDTGLNRKVGVVGVNTAMTPGGFLRVQVELLNRTHSLQNFNYHFEWFDQNGMQVSGSSTAVIPDEIDAKEDKFISAVAPLQSAKDFRLKLILGQ